MTQPMSRTRTRSRALCALALAFALAGHAPARADTVSDWNRHATEALVGTAGQAPSLAVLNLAMMHGAVYDAVNAIDRRHRAYLASPSAKRRYSTDAAAATAAYRILAAALPAQQAPLAALYEASLASIPAGSANITVGNAAARAMIAARAGDGRLGPYRFPVGMQSGQWRPLAPGFVNDPLAWFAQLRPFLIRRPSQFRSAGPNPLTSARYAREFAEVKALGALTSSSRTAEQTDIARFWGDHPAAQWSRILRQLAARHGLETAGSARLFAMLYLAAADALISCHNDKARWLSWRPITAIHEAGADGNPATEADLAWSPLLATPPFPEHPCAHACASASIVATLRHFFGSDRARFGTHSSITQTTRSFTRFSQAIEEVVDARVYAGVHFRTADVQGARIGRQVARWRERHYLQRTRRR